VVDLSTLAVPALVGSLDLPQGTGFWEWPVVSRNHLFVRANHNDPYIAIIDVGDPSAPAEVGSIDVSNNLGGLAVTGSWLLVPDIGPKVPEVRILDIRNPVAPVERDPYVPVNGYVVVVEVSGSVAYMSVLNAPYSEPGFGVEVVNFADPTAPEFMGLSRDTGFYTRLPAGPEGVFAVTLETGFDTFALCQGPFFSDGFESGDTTMWSDTVP